MHVLRPEGGPGFCSHHKLSRKEKSFSRWFSFWLTSYDERGLYSEYFITCFVNCLFVGIVQFLFGTPFLLLDLLFYLRIQREMLFGKSICETNRV